MATSKMTPSRFARIAAIATLASSLATTSLAQTIEAGTLQIGTDLTYPPYNYFDDNKQPAGFDVELMTVLWRNMMSSQTMVGSA